MKWGKMIGVESAAAYRRIKSPSMLSIDQLIRSCAYLGIKVDDFLNLDKKIEI